MKVFTTDEWGARPAKAQFNTAKPKGIIIHNTESANRAPLDGDAEVEKAKDVVRRIQNDHMGRNWSDTGQHFTISRGGVILEGRHGTLSAAQQGLIVQGAHAGKNAGDGNRHWFGIENEGDNVRAYAVPLQQWEALVELCAWLSYWGGFDSSSIIGHRDCPGSDTDCPGKLNDRLQDLRDAVQKRKVQLPGSAAPPPLKLVLRDGNSVVECHPKLENDRVRVDMRVLCNAINVLLPTGTALAALN